MGIPDGIETVGVTPPPHHHHHHNTHIHQGSFVPVIQKCPELAGGVYQYDILEILNFVGFFLIIVGQTLKIMLIKNNCR